MKTVIILRGVSGSGRSTFGEFIEGLAPAVAVCCADDYFTDSCGNYNFDVSKLGAAHKACQYKFSAALSNSYISTIVVTNTNVEKKQWQFYEDEAKKAGALIFFMIMENRHNNKDSHFVPESTLQSQEKRLRDNIKLR